MRRKKERAGYESVEKRRFHYGNEENLPAEGCGELWRNLSDSGNTASVEVEVRPDYDGEDRKISLDMTLELDICIWKETETDVVEDVLFAAGRDEHQLMKEVTTQKLGCWHGGTLNAG
ncbi:MAG: hypothetical protein ACLTOM_11855 [Roseburia sp.]